MNIQINIKGLPDSVTLGQLQEFERTFNSLIKSEQISLKCINGAGGNVSSLSGSEAPSDAQEIIDEMEGER